MSLSYGLNDYMELVSISASVDRGGWECRFISKQETNVVDLNQEVSVLWEGGFGGPPAGPSRLGFKGYVLPSNISANLTGSQAEFIAQTSDGYLRRGWLQGMSFAEVDIRNNYHETADDATECPAEPMAYDLNSGKIIKHILGYYDSCADLGPHWVAHTNLVFDAAHNPNGWIDLTNVEDTTWSAVNTGGSMAVSVYTIRETKNLWSRLQEIARNEFFFINFTKLDELYYRRHPMFEAALPTPVMTFDQNFCLAPITIIPNTRPCEQVVLHAVTDDEDVIHAQYPASAAFVYGDKEELGSIRCNSQSTLDYWAERLYLYLNRDYTVKWVAPGACGLLFELLDRVAVTYSGTSYNGVHVNWTDKKFWIHDIQAVPNPAFGAVSTFTLEAEST